MELTGTIKDQTGATSRITASGQSYDDARTALAESIPEGSALIVIRTDRDG